MVPYNPKNIFCMIGLHPCYVDDDYKNELDFVRDEIQRNKYYAIGEIGIDLYHEKKFLKQKVKIIGVGGVDSGKSAYEKIINGASLIQLYTGMIYKGPNVASKISNELINILKNYQNINKYIQSLIEIKPNKATAADIL